MTHPLNLKALTNPKLWQNKLWTNFNSICLIDLYWGEGTETLRKNRGKCIHLLPFIQHSIAWTKWFLLMNVENHYLFRVLILRYLKTCFKKLIQVTKSQFENLKFWLSFFQPYPWMCHDKKKSFFFVQERKNQAHVLC